ncbi:hypothetical protein WA026_004707 [Henosepilachna vigintioctopunctata]|uniref:EGF-like domain-containing protein n=1 Tax=Henosepilachna vigintioctopunctata TaxID=420089 RepID=A0AAW1V7P7_9CUCU
MRHLYSAPFVMAGTKSIKPISVNNFVPVLHTKHYEKVKKQEIMLLHSSTILLLFCIFQPSFAIDTETIKRCCGLGTNHSMAGNTCGTFDPSTIPEVAKADSVYCLHSVEVCCKRRESDMLCEAGEELALSGGNCNTAEGMKKACCEACILGKESFTSDPTCTDYLSLGPSFSKCCQSGVTSSSSSTTSTTTWRISSVTPTQSDFSSSIRTSEYLPPMENLCEVEGICAQICIPMGDSYKCDCNKGFSLMEDKVSCKRDKKSEKGTINRCDLNNPCEHECKDTGVAIKCLCREGYELDIDQTSCKDIDECALGTNDCNKDEICLNEDGTYYCEDPIYTDPPIDFDKKCPAGYKFNGENSVCDDIDECQINLLCPGSKTCKNTMGSYTCEGEDIKCPPGFYFKAATESCSDIDECLTGENSCNKESQICINTKGNYTCAEKVSSKTCPPGFKKNPYTQLCDDVDECSEDVPLCAPTEVCVNEVGRYNCVPARRPAPKPYTPPVYSTYSTPRTETTPYQPTMRHTSKPNYYPSNYYTTPMTCTTGFELSPDGRSCVDIDECTSNRNNCNKQTQICVNTNGSFLCTDIPIAEPCSPGFRKNPYTQQCDDINECAEYNQLCSDSEECVNDKGSYRCVRKTTYTYATTNIYTTPSYAPPKPEPTYPYLPPRTTTARPNYYPTPITCTRGFTLAPDRRTCVDINECQLGTHTCVETQRCDNTLGSYHCVRMAGCGTGYTYNYANEICEDDDECALGTHNCGGLGSAFKCRNTFGSYRCDPIRRPKPVIPPTTTTTTTTTTPRPSYQDTTTKLTIISGQRKNCLPGYVMNSRGECEDIDECKSNPCGRGESCFNTQGRYHCITKIQCKAGYDLNDAGDGCEDVNECVRGTHKCNPTQICRNGVGYYTCGCPPGHHLNPETNHCEDIDECKYYKVCYHNANCVNTVGSYRCDCKEGFTDNGSGCEDIDECARAPNLCEHKCVNTWGSYRCACQAGFTLNMNNRTCSDIDECERFKDKKLCIGPCENIPGSYQCTCPNGYRLGLDKRTCQDIDECERNVCPNHNDICVNTRGSYKCYTISCPANYIRDVQHKSRCKRPQTLCDSRDSECLLRPEQYTYHFIAIVSNLPMINGPIRLFNIQGPRFLRSRTDFQFRIISVNCPVGLSRINENYFRMDVQNYNAMVLYLTRSITGPQEAEVEIRMKLFDNNQLTMSAVSRIFIIVTEYPF